jgi:hypothetical protein
LTSNDRLDARISESLAFAARALESARTNGHAWGPDDGEVIGPREKVVTEAALLAYIAHRAIGDGPPVTRLVEALLSCEDVLDRMYELIRWRPYLWVSAGATWVILDQFGVGDARRRGQLRAIWDDTSLPRPQERVPYRLLDEAWLRTIARGAIDPLLDSDAIRQATSMANVGGGLHMNRSDLYAVTHAPMYLTDFGRRHPLSVERGWLGPLGAARLLIGDFDLAAELAIANLLVQPSDDVASVVIATALTEIFDSLGIIPAPTFRRHAHEASPDPDAYLTYHSYHTTFVYGLLCSVVRVVGRGAPPVTQPFRGATSTLPVEWHGRRVGLVHISDQVVHTLEAWTELCDRHSAPVDQSTLLRHVIDAYLLEAVGDERTEDALSLLGMKSVAGGSVVDDATRQLFHRRTSLSLIDTTTDENVDLTPLAE